MTESSAQPKTRKPLKRQNSIRPRDLERWKGWKERVGVGK